MLSIRSNECLYNEGDIKYHFYEFFGNKYCDWTGKYTSGLIGIRGTRLYFKKNAATYFDQRFEDNYGISKEDTNIFWASLNELEFPRRLLPTEMA